MSSDLLESLSGLLTPDLIGKAAGALGDSEPAVSKGLSAAFPVLLGSVANRANDADFAASLFKLVTEPSNDGSLLGNIGSLLAPGAASSPMGLLGGKFLNLIFGNNLGSLGNSLGNYAGVKASSGASILNFAAPLVLSMLSKAVRSGNLNLSSLVALLTGQKSKYAAAVPGPLSRLESYFAAPAAAYAAPPPPEPKSSIWRWLLPLLIALALLWLLSRCMGRKEETVEIDVAPTPAPAVEPAPLPAPAAEPAAGEVPLANLYFDVDKYEVPVAREGSLDAVIAYLKANPTAVASVSGYHDPTGDAAYNEELSKKRAAAVKDAMVAAGVPESQIDMVKPIATTGSGDMAEARRVEVAIRR